MPYILKLNLVYKCMYKLILKKQQEEGEYKMRKKIQFNNIHQYIVPDIVVGQVVDRAEKGEDGFPDLKEINIFSEREDIQSCKMKGYCYQAVPDAVPKGGVQIRQSTKHEEGKGPMTWRGRKAFWRR